MNTNSNDEIDLIDFLKILYKSRKLIIYISIIFSIMYRDNHINHACEL